MFCERQHKIFVLWGCLRELLFIITYFKLQLSARDALARVPMKDAAKCDKHCELQNSVNQQVLERILRFRDIPESMPASVSTHSHSHLASVVVSFCAPRRTCARDACSVSSSTRWHLIALHLQLCCDLSERMVLPLQPPRRPNKDMKLGQRTRWI